MADMGKDWAAEEEPSARSVCRMALGLAWEEWYGPRRFGDLYHPGEFEFDGVYFTPDAVDWEQRTVYEIKTTQKGDPNPERQPHWLLQVQGELWAIGQGEWTRAEFHVLRVSYPQEVLIWGLQFSPVELRRVWEMLAGYKSKTKPEVWK